MVRLSLYTLLALSLLSLTAPASAAPALGQGAAVPPSITAGAPTLVTATVQAAGGTPLVGGVNLLRQDASGKTTAIIGVMHDDGQNGDTVSGDNTYTLQTTLTEPAGTVYFAASAAFKGQLKRVVSSSFTVTVAAVSPPVVTGFSPASAAAGDPVTITGSGFAPPGGGLPQVTLVKEGGGTIAAAVTSASATAITFTVPDGADTGPLTVTAGGQSGVSASNLTITSAAPPTLAPASSAASVLQGQSTTYTLSFGPDPGFTQLVNLSVQGLPANVTATFAPAQITSGQFSTLTVTAAASQPVGTFPLTVTAAATVNGVPESQSLPLTLHILLVTTSFIGRTVVADAAQTPLAGVTVTFQGKDGSGNSTVASATTVSDASGNFMFTNLPAGYVGTQLIKYDGLTTTSPPGKYCGVDLTYSLKANAVTTSPVLIRLPRLDNAETVMVSQNAVSDQTFTFKTIPNLSVTVYAHTTITLPDGTQPNPFPLVAIEVPVDRLPDTMPAMQSGIMPFIVAFQPANTVASQPVAVTFPNTLMTPPNTDVMLSTLDPTKGIMVQYGTGTVSADGTQIIPDADAAHPGHEYGLIHFDWHGQVTPPAAANTAMGCPKPMTKQPVDLSSGIETETVTDIGFSGPRGSVALTRNYRTFISTVGPFGVGGSHNFNYLLDTISRGQLDLTIQATLDLVTPDGGQVPFAEQPDGMLTNSTIPMMRGAVIKPIRSNEADLRWKDGTVYHFLADPTAPGRNLLSTITDRNGNVTTITRDSTNPIDVSKVTDPVGRSLTFQYDSTNRIISVTDPIGRKVSYTYNSMGTLATVTDLAGGVTTYDYENGAANQILLTSITDPRGVQTVTNIYDGFGRVIEQDTPDGGALTIAYTLLNPSIPTSPVLQTVVTDPLGRKTTYRFNPQQFLLDATDPSGQSQNYQVESGSNLELAEKSNPSDASALPSPGDVAYTYDANGNVLTSTDALGQKTTFTYDPVYNQITSVTDANGHTSSFAYDGNGNLQTAADANGKATRFTYNSYGQVLTITDALGKKTTLAYDSAGNLTTVTDPLGHSGTIHYDAISRPVQATDALGQTSSVQYDSLNRVTQQTDPLGHTVSLAYDENGNLLSLTDALNHMTSFTYDDLNRLLTRKTPLGKTDSRQYDLAGNLTQFTDRRGQVSKFAYDTLDRLIGESYADGNLVARTYDAFGRLLTVQDTAGGAFSYAYDLNNRLLGSASPTGTIQYAYDPAGQRTARQVAGQSPVQYGYDPDGRLLSAAMPQAALQFAYDDRDELTGITRANGVSSSFGYDDAGRLLSLAHTSGATSLYSQSYTYDADGQRTGSSTSSAQPLITQPVVNTYDAGNRLTKSGATTYAYDDDGNLISETGPSGTTSYSWDTRGRLTAITTPIGKTNFAYDFVGNLLAQTNGAGSPLHTYLLDDATNVVAESDNGGTPAAVLTGLGIDDHFAFIPASGSPLYGMSDALNSTVEMTDGSGSVKSQFAYEPYGQTTANGGAYPFQYTGRVPVSSSLYYYRARFYNPILGRFISEDPIGFGGGINFYSYVNDDPEFFTDEVGLYATVEFINRDTQEIHHYLQSWISDRLTNMEYNYLPDDFHMSRSTNDAIGGYFIDELTNKIKAIKQCEKYYNMISTNPDGEIMINNALAKAQNASQNMQQYSQNWFNEWLSNTWNYILNKLGVPVQ